MSLPRKPLVVLYQPRKDERGDVNAPPYALLALAAVLIDEFEVLIFDGALVPEPWKRIEAARGARPVLAFGVTVMTGQPIIDACRFSQEARRRYAGSPVVWGGCHPSVDPGGTLRGGCVDFVVIGQGEIPFRDFLRGRRDRRLQNDVPGLGYIRDGVVHLLPPISPQKLANFPPRPFQLVDLSQYCRHIDKLGQTIIYITSQGCPFQCSFCSDTVLYGTHWSGYGVERMIREVRLLLGLGITGAAIFDNDFFVDRNRALDFCRKLQEEGISLHWQADIRVDQILKGYTSSELAEIRKAGCAVFFVGAESGSNKVLALLNKRITRDDTVAAAQKCRDAGIHIVYSFMTGFPAIYREEFRHTIALCNELIQLDNTDEIVLCSYTPYPGTALYQRYKELLEVPQELLDWGRWSIFSAKGNWIDKTHQARIQNAMFCLDVVAGVGQRHTVQTVTGRHFPVHRIYALFKAFASWRLRHQVFLFHVERHLFVLATKLARRFLMGSGDRPSEKRERGPVAPRGVASRFKEQQIRRPVSK